jgi:hypothetical protein
MFFKILEDPNEELRLEAAKSAGKQLSSLYFQQQMNLEGIFTFLQPMFTKGIEVLCVF